MDTLGDTIDRRMALPADSLCEAALAAFIHDLDCRALAIVDGERPIGIVHREPFLARMERPGAVRALAGRPLAWRDQLNLPALVQVANMQAQAQARNRGQ